MRCGVFFFLGLATLCDSFSEGNIRAFVLAGAVWNRKGRWAVYNLGNRVTRVP